MTDFEKTVLQKFDEIQNVQLEMLNRQDNLEKELKCIKITLENEVSPSIKMLSELQLENSKRLIRLERDVQSISDNIAIDEVLNNIKLN